MVVWSRKLGRQLTTDGQTSNNKKKGRVKTRSWGFRGTTWLFRGGVNRAHEGLDTRKNPPRWGRNFFLYQSPPDALPAALPAALPPASCTAGCVCLPHTSSLFSRVASGPAVELVRSSTYWPFHSGHAQWAMWYFPTFPNSVTTDRFFHNFVSDFS